MSPTALIFVLAALGVAGYVLLKESPAQAAESAIAKAIDEEGVQEAITEANRAAAATQAAQVTAANALLKGDLVTAAVAGLASLITYRSPAKNKRLWADQIVTVWRKLPDWWFLERGPGEAGGEIAAYVPHPYASGSDLSSWFETAVLRPRTYATWAYENLRRHYYTRIADATGQARPVFPATVPSRSGLWNVSGKQY